MSSVVAFILNFFFDVFEVFVRTSGPVDQGMVANGFAISLVCIVVNGCDHRLLNVNDGLTDAEKHLCRTVTCHMDGRQLRTLAT